MKTAVEWLMEHIQQKLYIKDSVIDQAKEMEKEQIKNAWIDGVTNWDSEKEVEDYINEIFKSE